MSGWRDISTAPRDFVTDIDLWTEAEGRLTDCSWMRPTYGPKEYTWCRHAYDDCNGPVYDAVRNPTHWMPLPEPPESSGLNLADAHSKNPPPQKEQQHEP